MELHRIVAVGGLDKLLLEGIQLEITRTAFFGLVVSGLKHLRGQRVELRTIVDARAQERISVAEHTNGGIHEHLRTLESLLDAV